MTTEVSEVQGHPVNHERVARVMREHGLQSRKRRRLRVVTTDSKHAYPVAANVPQELTLSALDVALV